MTEQMRTYDVRFIPPRPWTAENDRRMVENGWQRWRPEWGDSEIFVKGVRSHSHLQARSQVMGEVRLLPHDILISAPG